MCLNISAFEMLCFWDQWRPFSRWGSSLVHPLVLGLRQSSYGGLEMNSSWLKEKLMIADLIAFIKVQEFVIRVPASNVMRTRDVF